MLPIPLEEKQWVWDKGSNSPSPGLECQVWVQSDSNDGALPFPPALHPDLWNWVCLCFFLCKWPPLWSSGGTVQAVGVMRARTEGKDSTRPWFGKWCDTTHSFYRSFLGPFMAGPVLRNHWWTNSDTVPVLGSLHPVEQPVWIKYSLWMTCRLVLLSFPMDLTILGVSHFGFTGGEVSL